MPSPSQFPEWLSELSAAGLRLDLPPLRLGAGYAFTITLAEHDDLGDYTAGTFSMDLKASPGAASALASVTFGTATVSGSVTSLPGSLAVDDQSGLSAPVESGVTEVFHDLLYTVGSADPIIVGGGRIPLLAGVTA